MEYSQIDLPAKLPDRVFLTTTGNHYRVRLDKSDKTVVKAAPNIDPNLVAPVDIVLVLSIALVDETGSVLRAGDKLRISDRHEIGPINVAAVNSIPELIDHEIGKMIEEAEAKLVGVPEAMQLLSDQWGIDFAPPKPAYVPVIYLPQPEPPALPEPEANEPAQEAEVQAAEPVAPQLYIPQSVPTPVPIEPMREMEHGDIYPTET